MNSRKRYGNDFTESLHTFQENDTLSLNHTLTGSITEDSLQMSTEENKENYEDSNCMERNSIILAGNSAKKSLQSAILLNESDKWAQSNSFAVSSDMNENSDLNRCIIIHDDGDSNSIGAHALNSEFATNCTIQDDDEYQTGAVTSNFPSTVSEASSSNGNMDRDTNHNIKNVLNGEECNTRETDDNKTPKKSNDLLGTISFLNKTLWPSSGETALRRLSEAYAHSPKKFTERLLTIIEESVINNETDTCGLTKRFYEMCKLLTDNYIENESLIEFAPTLMSPTIIVTPGTPKTQDKTEIKTNDNNAPVSEKATAALNACQENIPTRHKRFKKSYRKTPNTIFRTNINDLNDVLLSEPEDTFLQLEDKCNRLFFDNSEKSRRRSLSMSSVEEMENMRKLSELQMASLEISLESENKHSPCNSILTPELIAADDEAMKNGRHYSKQSPKTRRRGSCETTPKSSAMFRTADTSYLSLSALEKKVRNPLKRLDYNLASREHNAPGCGRSKASLVAKKVPTISTRVSMKKSNLDEKYYFHADNLNQTLLQEIAEKRKRCLNTAKAIMEIDADLKVLEMKKSLEKYPELVSPAEFDSLDDNSLKFLSTLMSCDAYHVHLQKSKPLVDLQGASKRRVFKGSSTNLKESREVFTASRSPLTTRVASATKNQKFFVTPGKSPTRQTGRQKPTQYFSYVKTPTPQGSPISIIKSPHASGLYRKNYNTVMSPIGMYIRGTDMNLVQTVRSKTNEMLLTPRKTGQSNGTPVKTDAAAKSTLKIRLTPRGMSNVPSRKTLRSGGRQIDTFPTNGDENIPDNFHLPKVVYKSPLKVHTVKDTITSSRQKRIKALLQDAESKTVIRHEGKSKTADVAHDKVPEVLYGPLHESVHVCRTAKKTNFMRKKYL